MYNLASLIFKEQRLQDALSYIRQSVNEDIKRIDQSFHQSFTLYLDIILLILSRSGNLSYLQQLTQLKEILTNKLHSVSNPDSIWIRKSLQSLEDTFSHIHNWETYQDSTVEDWLNQDYPPIYKLRHSIDSHSPHYFTLLLIDHKLNEAVSLLNKTIPVEHVQDLVQLLSHHLKYSYSSIITDSVVDRPLSRDQATSLLRKVASLFPSLVPSDIIKFPRESDDNDDDLLLKLRSIRVITNDHSSLPIHPHPRDSFYPHSLEYPRIHQKRFHKHDLETRYEEPDTKKSHTDTEELTSFIPDMEPEPITIPSHDAESPVHKSSSFVSLSCCCILSGQEFHSTVTLTEIVTISMVEKEIQSILRRICVSKQQATDGVGSYCFYPTNSCK